MLRDNSVELQNSMLSLTLYIEFINEEKNFYIALQFEKLRLLNTAIAVIFFRLSVDS